MLDAALLHVLLVIFFATLIRSAFGFGEALIAVPLLALRMAVGVAAPLAALVSITVAALIVVQDWQNIHFRSAGWLLLSTIGGIPVGLVLLIRVNEQIVKGVLAILIIAFAMYSLFSRNRLELKKDSFAWMLVCGFCAGVLGGAYGMNGPPLVIYGAIRRWSPQHFRATLQGYFLPASTIGMAGYWVSGLWVPAVTHYYLASLPLTLGAVFLGRVINQRFTGDTFMKYVFAGLIMVGTLLLAQAIQR